MTLKSELYRSTFAAANPVALHFFDALVPINGFESLKQSLGVGADAHAPLAHFLLLHGVATTLAHTVFDFVVGQHGSQCRAPVHHGVGQVGEAIVHQDELLLLIVHAFPVGSREFTFEMVAEKELLLRKVFVPVGILRCIYVVGAVGIELPDERINVLCTVGVFIKPRIENLPENPLGPLVIFRIARAHFAVPIVGKTNAIELLAITSDVGLRSDFRVLPCLNGVLLGGQSEAVVSHGVQHVEALIAFVASNDIACYIAQRMPHVQARPTRVGKHVEHVVLRRVGLFRYGVCFVFLPALLPFALYIREIVVHGRMKLSGEDSLSVVKW